MTPLSLLLRLAVALVVTVSPCQAFAADPSVIGGTVRVEQSQPAGTTQSSDTSSTTVTTTHVQLDLETSAASSTTGGTLGPAFNGVASGMQALANGANVPPAESSTGEATSSSIPMVETMQNISQQARSAAETVSSSTPILCLAMIAPAPLEGPEWVAFYGITPSTTQALIGWSIHDAQGSVFKFATSSVLLWDDVTATIRVELRSARLNNDGDTVSLKTPAGDTHDTFAYPTTAKGHRWVREGCAQPWHPFPLPTVPAATTPSTPTAVTTSTVPGNVTPISTTTEIETPTSTMSQPSAPTAVIPEEPPTTQAPAPEGMSVVTEALPEPPATTAASASAPAPATPGTEAGVVANNAPATSGDQTNPVFGKPLPGTISTEITPETTKLATTGTSKAKTPATKNAPMDQTAREKAQTSGTKQPGGTKVRKTAAAKALAPKKPAVKPVTKRASAPKKTLSAQSLPMARLLEDPATVQGIRVRVNGRVASERKIVGTNRFVIVNGDGRGLLVQSNGKQPSPPFGASVDVTGTVTWNDTGLWLKQSASDAWTTTNVPTGQAGASGTESLPIRTVDLLAPGQEDGWSSLLVEGRVSGVQKASFDLDVAETTVRVRVPANVGYRVQRLAVGDTVSVQGLLDLRAEDPSLLVQRAEAVRLLTRAPQRPPVEPAPVERPWLPVGVAAGTLAASESWRRLKRRYKHHKEEQAFQKLLETSGQDKP